MVHCIRDLSELDDSAVEKFWDDGFIVIERAIGVDVALSLANRFDPLFRGEFDTGIYPDEWYWREGISLPNAVRHMVNAWKADRTIARFALSEAYARAAARLARWKGVRLGQDTLWWKVPGAPAGALHQDSSFVDFLDPPMMVTFWVALDKTIKGAGTIEYVPRSHRWRIAPRPLDFHAPEGGYRAKMNSAASLAGVSSPECVEIEIPRGGAIFHHGSIWHGSGPNHSNDWVRRSIGIHYLHWQARFSKNTGGYIYGRYKRRGSNLLDEEFFPIVWSDMGYTSFASRTI